MPVVDGLGLELDEHEGTVDCGGERLRLPRAVARHEPFESRLVLLLWPDHDSQTDPDFSLPDGTRNVVAVAPDCTHEWTVEAVPSAEYRWSGSSVDRHDELWNVHGRLVTKTLHSDRFFELDPETGAVLDQWARNEYKAGGKTHEFEGEVTDLVVFGPVVVVNIEQQVVYGFDAEGRQLWRRDDGRTWLVGENEADPILVDIQGRGPNSKFVLDPETGALTEHLFGPDDVAADVLGEPE